MCVPVLQWRFSFFLMLFIGESVNPLLLTKYSISGVN